MVLRTSRRSLLFALLIAGVMTSCKAPTAPSSNPTLTLILPDSARAYDTLVLHARYSDPLQPSWEFYWQFGDSSRATMQDTSIRHVYDSAGTYTVHVALIDSSKTIAKQVGNLQVFPLNGPALTLTAPDTVYWCDSCILSVSSSQPLQPTWRYTWSFGDTTTTYSTQQDSVLHWYLNPGDYTVRVELDDTARHIPLASRTTTVHVVARHFDLALLQSMKYVEVNWQAFFSTQIQGTGGIVCGPQFPPALPLTWSGTGFTMLDTVNLHDSQENGFAVASIQWSGSFDSEFTHIFIATDSNGEFYSGQTQPGSFFCDLTWESSFFSAAIFQSESDSEVVFKARGPFIPGSRYEATISCKSYSQESIRTQARWTEPNPPFVSYTIIRFYK